MTVKELTTHLRDYPPAMRVLVDGYEDNYDDLGIASISVVHAPSAWYRGDWRRSSLDENGETVVVLKRTKEEN